MVHAGGPIQGVLFTVFQSIFQVFLLCLAGFTLSLRGIVDKPTSKALNRINIALFTPALLFSKVAYFLTPAKLRQLWVIPIFFVILTGLSGVIAYWLARACRLKQSQVNFATAASMFMNSNSLPVALMQSLVTTVPFLKWGPDDTVDAMFGRSLTYLVVFSTLGMILRWSYGVHLLSQVDEPESLVPSPTAYRDVDDTNPALSHVTVDSSSVSLINHDTETDVDLHDRHVRSTRSLRPLRHLRFTPISLRHTHPHTRLHSHLPAAPTSLVDQSESEDTDELEMTEDDSEDTIVLRSGHMDTGFSTEAEDHASTPASVPLPAPLERTPRWYRDRLARPSVFKRILTTFTSSSPPLLASLFALFCVLVPPVQRLIRSVEMKPFKGALDSAGACSVPLTLLVLGGWFWDGESNAKSGHGGIEEDKVHAMSDGQRNTKNKGKGVEARHASQYVPYSRATSTTSLSSMIGAFGDVLMERIHRRRSAGRTGLRVEDVVVDGSASVSDVESGPQMVTHTETESGLGRPSTVPSSLLAPTSPSARGTNPPGETLTIFITLLARMVLAPLIVTPMMILITRLGRGGDVFKDPVFITSIMLLIASPPALTLAQISQRAMASTTTKTTTSASTPTNAADTSSFERLLSRTIFWAYLVLTPPLTIASVMVGLLLIKI